MAFKRPFAGSMTLKRHLQLNHTLMEIELPDEITSSIKELYLLAEEGDQLMNLLRGIVTRTYQSLDKGNMNYGLKLPAGRPITIDDITGRIGHVNISKTHAEPYHIMMEYWPSKRYEKKAARSVSDVYNACFVDIDIKLQTYFFCNDAASRLPQRLLKDTRIVMERMGLRKYVPPNN